MRTSEEAGSAFPAGIAVVFGGSGGIGEAICRELVCRGAPVALTYRSNRARADALAAQLRDAGGVAQAHGVDMTDREGVATLLQTLQRQHGRIHTVVLATGADFSMTYVSKIDAQEWLDTIHADLTGAFYVISAALPLLRQGGGGSLVAITSAGLDRHPPKDILSVAPKAGVEALMRGVAREEGRFGIRANTVAPGVLDGGVFDRLATQVDDNYIEAIKRNTALHRFGTLQEVAKAAVFLASSDASYITGQRLTVDGGYSV